MVYQWKTVSYEGLDAQTAGNELERINAAFGALTAKSVVDASRSEDAVLHNIFEWDDEKAAESHRESQARALIGNIVTISVDDEREHAAVRAFVHIQNEYRPVNIVLRVSEYKQEMFDKALKELASFQIKYSHLKELDDVFKSIELILSQHN